MTRRTARRVAITALQYAIALLALGWLVSRVDLQAVWARLASLDGPSIAVVLGVSLLGALAQFATWQTVLRPVGSVRFRAAAGISVIVNFVNQLLPSRLSGRLAAPFVIRSKTGLSYADAAAVSGVHTGVYAVLYGSVSTLGLLAIGLHESPPIGLLGLLALSTGLYLVAGGTILLAGTNLPILDPAISRLARAANRLPAVGEALADRIDGLTDFTEASTETVRALAADGGVWLRYGLAWAVVLLVAPALRVWVMLTAFGVEFEPALLLPLYLVTAYSVTLLPLTPGGIGVTEATATAVFVSLGVPRAAIVPIVFVDRLFGIYLPALIGWYPAARLDLSAL
ncbi:MAG: lysylphosphatidylglycerol synthase transmembrane domain-containing protein [Halodesulfurarchaeum sp.]